MRRQLFFLNSSVDLDLHQLFALGVGYVDGSGETRIETVHAAIRFSEIVEIYNTQCYIERVSHPSNPPMPRPVAVTKTRAFKTRHCGKVAARLGIADVDLCQAVAELDLGQGDNLGGNVWKKRLRNNLSRTIVLTKPTTFWIFVHVFEKQDKANIAVDELSAFKKLAKDFECGGIEGIEVGLKNEPIFLSYPEGAAPGMGVCGTKARIFSVM